MQKMKICFPTSSGGHLTQLMQLRPFWSAHNRFWVTFDKKDANSKLSAERVYHCHYPTNRNIPNLLRNTVLAWKVLRHERPDLIMTTGAAVAIPFFLVGKLMGAKTVYIEVVDRIDAPTLSGRICKPFTDLFVVQWPEMEGVYEGSVCLGSVF